MKLTRVKRNRSSAMLEMASMIDVVFLLLIFFICTASFSKTEDEIDASSTAPGASGKAAEFDSIRITLSSAKSAGTYSIRCDQTQCADRDALTRELTRRRSLADATVIVEGTRDVPFEAMVQVLNIAKRARFNNVAFSLGGQ